MIKDLFPRGHKRYLSLPVLGSMLDKFSEFLKSLEYPRHTIRCRLRYTPLIDYRLKQFGCHSIKKITRKKLLACAPPPKHSQYDINVAATTKLLEKFFDKQKIFPVVAPSLIEKKVFDYCDYLKSVRGFALSTLHNHSLTASQFLLHLKKRHKFPKLEKVVSRDIEAFLTETGNRVGRGSLQHIVAQLRSFLRFLIMLDEVAVGLDNQIDTPRVYREEKLPHALSWDVVQILLRSIERKTAIGKRDYAMLLLITTYGLRASEIVALKFDDIDWQANLLKIFQRKTNNHIILPITNAIGKSIFDYLQKGRPSVPYREIFVRHRAPNGILKATAINEVFQYWSRRSGLSIPFQGSHCLRHSYAIHLLRQGTSIKTIGDILGHRNLESTCVYLRLNIDDLRIVPLSLPT